MHLDGFITDVIIIGLIIIVYIISYFSDKKMFGKVNKLTTIVSGMAEYLDVFRENKEYIDMMIRMKEHAISTKFVDTNFRLAIEGKCETFIGIVSKLVEDMGKMPVITTKEYEEIAVINLDNGFEEARAKLAFNIGKELADEYYNLHAGSYLEYKRELRIIFEDLSNSKRKRVLNESNKFLLEFIGTFASFADGKLKEK